MTEPIDPNGASPTGPAYGYRPPPPFTPPAEAADQPWPMAPQTDWAPPPPPPSHRGRNLLIVALVVLVLAACGVGAYLTFRGSATDRLAIPSSFDGYRRLTNGNASRVESAMRSFAGSSGSKIFASATVGSYARDSGDTPRLIVLVLPTRRIAAASNSSQDVVQGLLTVVGPSAAGYPPGPHGGSSECGRTTFGVVEETLCAWSDPATTGVMVSVLAPMTPRRLSRIELDLRDSID
jgi:hypothetical protein